MIRRYSKGLVAGAVLLAATLGTIVYAQGDGPGQPGPFGHLRHGMRGFPLFGRLELTEAQREQVRDIMERYQEQMRATGRQLHEAHEAQRAAVEAIPVNEGLIRSTTQALANAQTEMALLHARIHNDVWAILTPEQQEKAKQLKGERESRLKQRLERRPRRSA